MRRHPTTAFHPDLEPFEAKTLLSAGAGAVHIAHLEDGSKALHGRPVRDVECSQGRP